MVELILFPINFCTIKSHASYLIAVNAVCTPIAIIQHIEVVLEDSLGSGSTLVITAPLVFPLIN